MNLTSEQNAHMVFCFRTFTFYILQIHSTCIRFTKILIGSIYINFKVCAFQLLRVQEMYKIYNLHEIAKVSEIAQVTYLVYFMRMYLYTFYDNFIRHTQ